MARRGKLVGVYGPKTRLLQRRLSYEVYGLSFKQAEVYLYLGDRSKDNPSIDDINTHVFFEVPDRAYAEDPISIPIGMEQMPEKKTDFSRFGLINPLQDETLFRVHIDDFLPLGRELIVGDVFKIPFFEKNGMNAFWEVNDVDLSQEYEKFIAIVHATPLGDKRTTREIPIDQSNSGFLDDMMANADQEYANIVPTKDLVCDGDEPPEPEDIDFRDDKQASFLDDPNKEL